MKNLIIIISLLLNQGGLFSQEIDSLNYHKDILHDSLSICNGEAKKAFKYYKKYFEEHEIKNHVKFYKEYIMGDYRDHKFRGTNFQFVIRYNCGNKNYPNVLVGGVVFYKRKIERFYFSQ